MLGTLAKPNYHWFANTSTTAQEVVGGYALAVVLGVGIALMFSWSRIVSLTLFPLFVTLNMVPKIALGPLIIVWLGYGLGPNIVITFAISFFPVLLNTLRGLSEVEPDLLDLVRALKGSRWQVFTKVQLPGSLPYIFSGMRVAAILAMAGAVVGGIYRLRARPRLPHGSGPHVPRYGCDVHGGGAAHSRAVMRR